jgi:hypothetical protein
MLSALLFTISLVALVQFGVYYWRALMLGVATGDVSEEVPRVAGLGGRDFAPGDFEALVELNSLCPGLCPVARKLSLVRVYYTAVSALSSLSRSFSSSLATWANREMMACARYVAVRTSQQIHANTLACADLRSY